MIKKILYVMILSFCFAYLPCAEAEEITLSTYYPAPYGEYESLSVSGSLAFANWADVSFGTGWSNYGSGYQSVQYKKFGDLIFLRGLASSQTNLWAAYPVIFVLPDNFRPSSGRLVFSQCGNANAIVRVDITTAGQVRWVAGGAGNDWISLDGIIFSVD
jgi:hypothetical protein